LRPAWLPTADCPLTDSIAVLNRVVLAVEEFLDTISWPP
jgi:hypothetical protein